MLIDANLLLAYGAIPRKLQKGEFIFTEDTLPRYFFAVLEGQVKVVSTNNEGKEFIQGIFHAGQSFGEPPLLINRAYPSTAIAVTDTVVLRLAKEKFLHLVDDSPDVSHQLLNIFAERIYNKAVASHILNLQTPEEKILHFFEHVKMQFATVEGKMRIPYTRQQIADFTGLRVETVIRTLTRMQQHGKVDILKHKVYY